MAPTGSRRIPKPCGSCCAGITSLPSSSSIKWTWPAPTPPGLMGELKRQLSDGCVDFSQPPAVIAEEAALCSEETLEAYLRTGQLSQEELAAQIARERLFPCFPGSALKLSGSTGAAPGPGSPHPHPQLSPGICRPGLPDRPGTHKGNRLTYLKVTGRLPPGTQYPVLLPPQWRDCGRESQRAPLLLRRQI